MSPMEGDAPDGKASASRRLPAFPQALGNLVGRSFEGALSFPHLPQGLLLLADPSICSISTEVGQLGRTQTIERGASFSHAKTAPRFLENEKPITPCNISIFPPTRPLIHPLSYAKSLEKKLWPNQQWHRTGPRGCFTQCPLWAFRCTIRSCSTRLPGPLHAALACFSTIPATRMVCLGHGLALYYLLR